MICGRARWQGPEAREEFNIVLTRQEKNFFLLCALQGHSERNPIDPTRQDNVSIPYKFFDYICKIGCEISVHSITTLSWKAQASTLETKLIMIDQRNPLSAVTQVKSQVTSQCWTRWTLTSEYLDRHLLLWNKLRTRFRELVKKIASHPHRQSLQRISTTKQSLQPVQFDDKANDSKRGRRRGLWTVRDGP